ncbi:MAG: DUF2231 domain-containing protein, partial [Verrucomicrobiota bacterium]
MTEKKKDNEEPADKTSETPSPAPEEEKKKRNIASWISTGLTIGLILLVFIPWEKFGGDNPSSNVLFLGRFHPMVLHMPIGFIFAVFILEVFSFFSRKSLLEQAAYILLWFSTLTAWVAVFLGVFLSMSGGYGEELMSDHRWSGISVAVFCLWSLRLKIRMHRHNQPALMLPYRVLLLFTVGLLGLAGHHGGSLTHGTDYLFKY